MAKTAIITGSTKGIGKDIAYTLANNEYNVIINSRNQKDADKIAQEISEKFNVATIGIEADVTKFSQVNDMVKKTLEKFGQVDVLVNNAGILVVKSLVDTTEKEWDDVLNINLKGTFLCTKAVLPQMISQNSGCIVNISSGAGKSGFAELSAYCSSKFGVVGFGESVAEEVLQNNIQVVTICPGAVATDMQLEFMGKQEYESRKDSMIQPSQVSEKVLDAINGKFQTGSSISV